ncbi:MAG: M14 family zinc carboxypeptidase, partial [Thermoleophilaceae bacterium]
MAYGRWILGGLAALLSLAAPATASAAELLSTTVQADRAVERDCIERPLAGAGQARRSVTAPATGWVSARLEAASGDWDLAIFDAQTGRRVAGSAQRGASELAQGIATRDQALTVQACRRTGDAGSATLDVESRSIEGIEPERLSLVRVSTPNADRKAELVQLGLDLTEHGGPGFVEVVLHGADDARRLREAKFVYTTEIADLAQASARRARADARMSSAVRASALPSSRTTYRRLDDYSNEMKQLVAENPTLVKPITLPFPTLEGRSVEGIEITTDVNARDGKPVFLQMGAHHAREWPSSEHAMEWAYELINGFRAGDARVRRLVSSTRTIVIPVVNPDGFNTSREAGEAAGAGGGRPGPDDTAFFATVPYEYQRKNCRVINPDGDDPEEGDCMQMPASGLEQFGVDPNRNYGGFWGGPGASAPGGTPPGDYAQDYRGNGPFSERETQNIRALVSSRHVTTLITNHTFSNLVLRPPGIQSQGPSVDEPIYKALGDAMAAENGYASQFSYQLYDTTGTTEDWTYYTTGGLGFTFEIGPSGFHQLYADAVIAEYEGTTEAADENGDGGGNRAAYFIAQENTADASKHSVLEGSAPAGTVLRLKKSFKTSTSPVLDNEGNEGAPILFDDTLDTTTVVLRSGRFEWHINPSTRPIVDQDEGRPATGSPSPPVERNGNPPPPAACPTYFLVGADSCPPGSIVNQEFDIPPNGGGVDNGFATVRIEWLTANSDYDMEIYRDLNNDGDSDDPGEDEIVASSAQGSTSFEETTLGPDPEPGGYVARVINFAAAEPYDFSVTFEGPKPFKPGGKESWTLTCEFPEGRARTTQQVQIDRGQRQTLDLSACASAAQAPRGGSQAAGDFNADDRTDLAIGSPGENRGSGAVSVLPGSDNGLRARAAHVFTQRTRGVEGSNERRDAFGQSLAAGDFDGDGFDDLAIGAPGEAIGRGRHEGAVTVLWGSSEGLRGQGSRLLYQGRGALRGSSERGDRLGEAVGAFDLNGDGRADLVIGSPGEDVHRKRGAGAANVLYGAAQADFSPEDQLLSQDDEIAGRSERGDAFGTSFASADFDGDGLRDLAVGAPGERVRRRAAAGAVNLVSGGADRLGGGGILHQGDGEVAGRAERGDRFGQTLALGDFDGDRSSDLAVGAPGEDIRRRRDAGAANVLFGGATSLGERGAIVHQARRGVAGSPERGDSLGSALAVGDLNGDAFDDLGLGAEGETMRGRRRAGAANVVYGAAGGLGSGRVLWHQNRRGVEGRAERGDVLAGSLGIADTSGSGPDDLTLGVPGEDLRRRRDAGVVHLLTGGAGGVTASGSRMIDQTVP